MTASQRRRPADRDAQIIRAASTLFSSRGFARVAMADIAADVGVGASALYRHFPTKLDLLRAVVDQSIEGVARIGASPDLDAAVTLAANAAARDRYAAVLWQREARNLDAADRAALARRLVAAVGELAQRVQVSRAELSYADCSLLAWAAIAVFGSTGMHRASLPRNDFAAQLSASARAVCAVELRDGVDTLSVEPAPVDSALLTSTREAILAQAIRLFADRGYTAVSTNDIGQATGTSGPNIYKHFPSKADILVAIAVRAGEHRRRGTVEALSGVTDPAERLTRLLHAHITFAVQQRELMGVLTGDLQQLPTAARRSAQSGQASYLKLWVQTLTDAHDISTARARIVVPAALAVVDDAVRTRQLADRPDLPARLAEICAAVLAS